MSRGRTRTSTRAAAAAEVGPDDLLTLIYTSGTTGHPKGVQLTHHAVMVMAHCVEQMISVPGRLAGDLLASLGSHRRAQCAPLHPDRVRRHGDLRAQSRARSSPTCRRCVPNWFFAVPRIWEKLKAGLEAMQAAQPEEQRRPVQEATRRPRWSASGCASGASRCRPSSRRKWRKADVNLFSKLREMLGLDQAIWRSTSARRRRRSRCSSSSTRSGSSWPSCGGCPRRAVSGPSTGPERSRSGRSGRPPRASSSSSPTTASCSAEGAF